MWVCTRHTRMRWFKSPWTPPTKFIQESKLVQSPRSLKASRDRPPRIRLSVAPSFLMIWHQIWSTVARYSGQSINVIPFYFFVVVFSLLSSPSTSCSCVKGLKKLILARIQVKSRDRKCHQRRKSTGWKKWWINTNDLNSDQEIDSLSRHLHDRNTNVWWFHSWWKTFSVIKTDYNPTVII